MEKLSFAEFVWRTGLKKNEIICLAMASIGILFMALRGSKSGYGRYANTLGDNLIIYHGGQLLMIGIGFFFAYQTTYDRYILRSGVGRYLVGRVTGYSAGKGGHNYFYSYKVPTTGQVYKGHESCEQNSCPPLGAHYYICYSVVNPAVSHSTDILVTDTLQAMPPLGWPKLP
jgi:hypothetical protein